ncbi:MAG: polyprenol monophosphomannose synthase [Candidatus Omnitrophica bacterium]|nr:polyprenol monophosphomannose synthase [Candidatus Omnitrophota bacterium]
MKTVVIIPTYNERDNIADLIGRILKLYPYIDILVIDDNSPDGSFRIVEDLAEEYANIYLISRPHKLGLASAYREGFKWALERDFDYIIQMDADFSHKPRYIEAMLEKARSGADLVIGSRYSNGKTENWPRLRLLTSWAANNYARRLLGVKAKDLTSGFRCFRKEALEEVYSSCIHSKDYAFQVEMVYLFWKKGFVIEEIPIVFIGRKAGKSKFSFRSVVELFILFRKFKRKEKFFKDEKTSFKQDCGKMIF